MKPSEILKKQPLIEIEMQLDDISKGIDIFRVKFNNAVLEKERLNEQRRELIEAIEELESKGL